MEVSTPLPEIQDASFDLLLLKIDHELKQRKMLRNWVDTLSVMTPNKPLLIFSGQSQVGTITTNSKNGTRYFKFKPFHKVDV